MERPLESTLRRYARGFDRDRRSCGARARAGARARQVKEWKKQIRKEIRVMEREIKGITDAEKKMQREIQAVAKKGCACLARLSRARRAR